MENFSFQNLFTIISPCLPKYWEKLVLFVFMGNDTSEIKFYIKENGYYTDCFSLGLGKEILQIIYELNEYIQTAYNSIDSLSKWKTMIFILNSTGEFDSNFGYENVTNKYINLLEKEYLI